MSDRASQLHATADGQISELIGLLTAGGAAALSVPCPGREKMGDGTVAAFALHTADRYQLIAGFLQARPARCRGRAPGQAARHRIPRFLLRAAMGLLATAEEDHDKQPGTRPARRRLHRGERRSRRAARAPIGCAGCPQRLGRADRRAARHRAPGRQLQVLRWPEEPGAGGGGAAQAPEPPGRRRDSRTSVSVTSVSRARDDPADRRQAARTIAGEHRADPGFVLRAGDSQRDTLLDLGDHQLVSVGVDHAHLLAWTRAAVFDLAGLDAGGEKLLAQRL